MISQVMSGLARNRAPNKKTGGSAVALPLFCLSLEFKG
jgi:hypothetical protein